VRTTWLPSDEGGREGGRAAGVVSGYDDGSGIDASGPGTGGGEEDRGGGIDRGDEIRFVVRTFGRVGDRETVGLGGTTLSCEGGDRVGNDFRG
jgi:hypothetical protein